MTSVIDAHQSSESARPIDTEGVRVHRDVVYVLSGTTLEGKGVGKGRIGQKDKGSEGSENSSDLLQEIISNARVWRAGCEKARFGIRPEQVWRWPSFSVSRTRRRPNVALSTSRQVDLPNRKVPDLVLVDTCGNASFMPKRTWK